MLRLFNKFPISTDPLKFSKMKLEDDDDLVTMIAIYCPLEIENPSLVELFSEIAKPDPIQVVIPTSQRSEIDFDLNVSWEDQSVVDGQCQLPKIQTQIHLEVLVTIEDGDKGFDNDDQSHYDPNDDFSDPNLDDIPEDIDEESRVEGENANPYLARNTGPSIVIRNNPGSFMTDVDPNTTLAHEFPEYTNIVRAHLLDDEFDNEKLFIKRITYCDKAIGGSVEVYLQTWLGNMENWKWTQSYDEWFRLAILIPRMGLRQAKQIEVGHVYVEAVQKAMAVNNRRAETKNVELYLCDLETFGVQEYIDHHSGLPLRNEFPVISNVSNREVLLPAFEMVLDRSLHRHPKGRPQPTGIRNDMDVKETGEPKLCTVCRTSRHNRSTYPHHVYVSDQSSRNTGLKNEE
ncbi:hypothetical protein J1N35_044633 [Gossypium stocksii]|uniref:Uncharacterized protein n=1 Tax=Gossypium stocksii TaxID=47602 RepID=A0A9D3U9R8_9ROSI|nr:hypothetical protein J1N35_044633 [Gossypium stocksii]